MNFNLPVVGMTLSSDADCAHKSSVLRRDRRCGRGGLNLANNPLLRERPPLKGNFDHIRVPAGHGFEWAIRPASLQNDTARPRRAFQTALKTDDK